MLIEKELYFLLLLKFGNSLEQFTNVSLCGVGETKLCAPHINLYIHMRPSTHVCGSHVRTPEKLSICGRRVYISFSLVPILK